VQFVGLALAPADVGSGGTSTSESPPYSDVLARCIIQFRAGTDSWPSSLPGPVRVAWCGGIGATENRIRWARTWAGNRSHSHTGEWLVTWLGWWVEDVSPPLSAYSSQPYQRNGSTTEVKTKTKEKKSKSTCPRTSSTVTDSFLIRTLLQSSGGGASGDAEAASYTLRASATVVVLHTAHGLWWPQ